MGTVGADGGGEDSETSIMQNEECGVSVFDGLWWLVCDLIGHNGHVIAPPIPCATFWRKAHRG